ncbi:MAG: tRNA lysidine(34) synthetase TilS [Methyloligella sp. ZOD6]
MTQSSRPLTPDACGPLFAELMRYDRVAVAVSGGPDSLALLSLLQRWTESQGQGPAITVLTVDHGLRPESAAEAETVARIADEMGLPHETLRWEAGRPDVSGLQARARQARYDLLAACCHEKGIPALLTAHHLDDQAETFLMRLARGSGLDGLAAIPAQGDWAGIAIHRPLLDVPKARLIATAEAAGLAFTEDASNRDPRFERVRLRGETEALGALGLTPEAIALAAKRLSRARAALDRATETFLSESADLSRAGSAEIDLKALLAAPEEISLRALQRLIAMAGGRQEPLRLAKLEVLLQELREIPLKTRTLGGCRLAPVGERLAIARETRRRGIPDMTLMPGQKALWDNRFLVSLEGAAAAPVTVRPLGEEAAQAVKDLPWLRSVPRWARASLPSCWRNQALLSVSCQGLEPETARRDAKFSARFVHALD